MAQKQYTNLYAYLITLLIFTSVVTGLVLVGNETLLNPNADLDNDSIEYITAMQGINLTEYRATKSEVETPVLINQNFTQANPKDQALDFQFAKERGTGIEIFVKGIFSMPSVILYDLLRFNKGNWNWIVNLINWVWRLLLIMALVYFARGTPT